MADETGVGSWDLTARSVPLPGPVPDHRTWELEGGTAWVFLASGKDERDPLTRPVILSDGFHPGATDLEKSWWTLDREGFGFASAIRGSGHDLVVLGYDDCTASILENADAAIECVERAIAERQGTEPLTVGGFSMGGLVTRYALAKMETDGTPHETALYVCYDSPHHGAWLPVALQGLAHYLGVQELLDMVDSPAACQLMRYSIPGTDGEVAGESDERQDFLQALEDVGSWPWNLHRIGVANGRGDGTGNGVPAGSQALRCWGVALGGTKLDTQASGDHVLVAELRKLGAAGEDVKTSGLPEADGAPGGMLESFGIVADRMRESFGVVTCAHPWVAFVPTGSAIAVTDLDPWEDLTADLTNATSDLHEFKFASDENGPHTLMTEELCSWIIARLP